MTVTFFGHRSIPSNIEMKLEAVLIDLIENYAADCFYLGNQGAFDALVYRILKKIKNLYSEINYYIVLAYLPSECKKEVSFDYSHTIYSEGLENTPRKFAIIHRNRWMIEHSDTVITFVEVPFGGAAQFKELAEKKGKRVINLADFL